MSKYAPLEDRLINHSEPTLTLTYAEMEECLAFPLPHSAYKHRAWWSNGKKGGSKFWLRAGWMVSAVDLGVDVTFQKGEPRIRQTERPTAGHDYLADEDEGGEGMDIMLSLDLADVPTMIRDLHQLMLEKVITAEEFEEIKGNLLALL